MAGSSRAAATEVSVPRQRADCGGYDCEFVTPPPDAFQAECPVCLQVLKEPCVISCPCGQKICRECVEQIKKEDKPCPLCNLIDFTYIRDYGLERYLKEQEVWCSKKKCGCEWREKLREYEQHLNKNSSPENQLTGCQFVEIECKHGCGERFQRRHITSHQNKQCRMRPYSCEYCHDCDSTFEDITVTHYPECKKYPVSCPNGCQDNLFERQEMELHLKEECPHEEVNCPLHYAGCEVRLSRKDMPEHMRDTVTHLTLLATVTQTLLKENQELKQCNQQLAVKQSTMVAYCQNLQKAIKKENETLKKEVKKLQQNIDEHKKEIHELKQCYKQLEVNQSITTEAHCREQKATEKEVEALKKADRELRLMLGRFPIDFHVNYTIKETQYLPSFYTHSHGYRMCIYVNTNGFGDGKGTHVSIFTHLMKGPYDDRLKWPFRGVITIQIVNQAGDHSHDEKTIHYEGETPDDAAGRVIGKERARGWGVPKFLAHTDLEYNATKKTQYLKDDVIIVRFVRVKITQ